MSIDKLLCFAFDQAMKFLADLLTFFRGQIKPGDTSKGFNEFDEIGKQVISDQYGPSETLPHFL